jgi:hypothetical protein
MPLASSRRLQRVGHPIQPRVMTALVICTDPYEECADCSNPARIEQATRDANTPVTLFVASGLVLLALICMFQSESRAACARR